MPAVVTCLLTHNDKLLILRRSNKVSTYKGLWSGVAGYVEENEQPYETAVKEIAEETGLRKEDVKLVRIVKPIGITDTYQGKKYDWVIHPFVFKVENIDKISIDWEHSDYRWISPTDIVRYETVPHLKEMISLIFK